MDGRTKERSKREGKEAVTAPLARSPRGRPTGRPGAILDLRPTDRPADQLSPISLHLSEYELTTTAGTVTADRPRPADREQGYGHMQGREGETGVSKYAKDDPKAAE